MQALDLTDLKVARIALILDDVLLRAVRQRNHAAIRVLYMQVTPERNHGDHIKVAQMINQAMQFIDRHRLVEQHLIGLGIDTCAPLKATSRPSWF